MGYIVKAACAMVRVGDKFETINRGGAVPAGADKEHLQVLIDRGLVVEGEPVGFEVDPNIPPPFVAPVGSGSSDAGEFPVDGSNEEKDAWVAKTNVPDLIGFVDAHPELSDSVLAAEKRGKDRKSVVEKLEGS